MVRSTAARAGAGEPERIAARADLETLRDGGESELRGNGVAIPAHERGADFEDFVAVEADDLGDLVAAALFAGPIEFFAGADVDLAEQFALGHDRERAVNGGAGDGIVDVAGVIEQLFGGEMLLLCEGSVEDGEPLVGDAQAFLGEKFSELFARSGDVHEAHCCRGGRCVNA